MSDFWSWYVIVIVALNIGGCAVLLWANRKMSASEAAKETTGHNFDGIEERNTPLPRWWLILFWLTLGFAIVYLVLYPGMGNYEGTLGWSSHKQWQEEVELVEARTAPLFAQYAAEPVEELIKYDEVMGVGARLFANNCAVCHGADARGARGYPNLTDDDWLYGGRHADRLYGEEGNDRLYGNQGKDRLYGRHKARQLHTRHHTAAAGQHIRAGPDLNDPAMRAGSRHIDRRDPGMGKRTAQN